MSFTFNKETRRSLRERIRDGINLIPGAQTVGTVVQETGNIINNATGGGDKKGAQQKSHSVDSSTSVFHVTAEPPDESISIIKEQNQQSSIGRGGGAPSSPSYLTADTGKGGDGEPGSRSGSVSSCSSSTSSSPSKYRTYVVKTNDTVTSIAASFDCTPSELMRVNRLITARVLFPGQVLKIPHKRLSTGSQPHSATTQQSQQTTTTSTHQHDPATATILESITYAQRKFLKIKVRHVTDGNGVVTGTLLITPNAVMFDPNVSDPLVIEQGAETYGIIVPIEYIVGASIWSDICGMRVRGKEAFVPPGPRPVLWGEPVESQSGAGEASSCNNDNKTEGDGEGEKEKENKEEQQEEAKEKKEIEGEEESSSSDGTPVAPTSPKKLEQVTEHPLKESEESGGSSTSSQEPSITTWYFCLTIGKPKTGGGEGMEGGGGTVETMGRVSISRRAPFCVTYGQKNTVRPEFWFSVAREQVPELYKYWMFWWPTIYGEVDFKAISERGYEPIDWDNLSVLPDSTDGLASCKLGSSATSATKPRSSNGGEDGMEEQSMAQELNELTKESWEVVTNEELRNLLAMGGEEMMAINLPDLIGGKSEILEEEDLRNITRHLTARAEGYPWTLIFSSSRDGFSLNSLYRRNSLMQEDSPVMLIVQDTNSRVFGALVSCSLHTSDSFYGTGQSFLFTLRPEFNVFKWTGENLFFVKGNHDGIWIGAGDGKFGLYVDGDLNCGRTEPCQTYGNPPLTEPEDFIIKTLECWAFRNYIIGGNGNNDLISSGVGGLVAAASIDTCKQPIE